ncbi:MotA/TolQ/ExbB proton channel family protein [Allohahella marinimesophila]|uniref:MotA/TolQ/ExbB proton channel domain-containing protein n=1 Tax=Allohahella marinimesophila TaxID=1054972 RepID=A0ABP7PBL3_9GAMM
MNDETGNDISTQSAPPVADDALADSSISAIESLPASDQIAAQGTDWMTSALEMIEVGGPVVVVLLAMSVIALTVVLVKLAQFQRARMWQRQPARQALALWNDGQVDKALSIADANANPTAQALARAIRGQRRQLPEASVREEVLRYGADALFHLRRGLRPLEVIGSLAPLLGLLGTVMGMISAFQQLEDAGNKVNPAILSGGIWEALLTTAVGLCVAIPVVALLNWLERRVDHLAHEMDNLVTQVFTEDLSAASEKHQPREQNPADTAQRTDATQPRAPRPASVSPQHAHAGTV